MMISSDAKCRGCGRYASEHAQTLAGIPAYVEGMTVDDVKAATAKLCPKTETEVLREELTRLQESVRLLYGRIGMSQSELMH